MSTAVTRSSTNKALCGRTWLENSRSVLHLAALTLIVVLLFPAIGAQAQQREKIARIGFLCPLSSPGPPFEAFRRRLQELGYVEGQNVVIDVRYAKEDPKQLPALAAELVRSKVDVLVPMGPAPNRAARQATAVIPIVMTAAADPVALGLVASLARPGGNITGVSVRSAELAAKRLELLKEFVPGLARVGVLWDPQEPEEAVEWSSVQAAARKLGLQVQSVEVPAFAAVDDEFVASGKLRPDALVNLGWISASMFRGRHLVKLAARHRLPAMYARTGLVEAGGLISYGPNWEEVWRQLAAYVDKVLKGAIAADLPVEQPTRFELVINLKTAKALGLTVPPSVLLRADRIIE
jgi:putative ABC transport system substrate-binding protein